MCPEALEIRHGDNFSALFSGETTGYQASSDLAMLEMQIILNVDSGMSAENLDFSIRKVSN